MTETFKKLSEEFKAAISAQMQTKEMKDFLAATKAADGAGSFEVVISTADFDRQGETINQNGWELDPYRTNPIVLWAHDYSALPIGIADEIEAKDGKLIARGRFAPESANPFAQQVRRLYDLKIVRATSVGFIVKEAKDKMITKAELLEFSFVPVPANPFALSLAKIQELGLDVAMLGAKGIEIKEEKAEGDLCTLEDGTEGTMKPDAEGNLICMPKVEEKPEVTENFIRIPVKDEANYEPDSIRTIDIDAEKGIKALSACPKGSWEGGVCSVGVEVITYLFDNTKWDEAQAQAWVDEQSKAAAPETKGEIGDQVQQDDMRKQKWENLTRVWDIFDAFIGVYLNDDTPVNDFQKLLEETIGLMQQATKGESKAIAEALDNEKRERHIKFETIQSNTSAASAKKGGEGEERPDGGAPQQRSRAAGFDDKKALNEFLFVRQVLRAVNLASSKGLERLNEKVQALYKKRK